MSHPDFNLLRTLDAVLAEGSIAAAARRLGLSPSAMSRSVARLRAATGDPLLVRAGRKLVPTPRALELRQTVGQLMQDAEAALRPAKAIDLTQIARAFTIRTSDGFVENFGPELVALAGEEAPGVRLTFVQKASKESTPLRDGNVDLETGVIDETTGPEVRAQTLFRDRLVGVVRTGHPLTKAKITPARYAGGRHVNVSRRGFAYGRVDESLAPLELQRDVAAIVGGFSTAVALARGSNLVATVPERHTGNLRFGMHSFPLPFDTPAITVSMLWHPRLDADPAHRWLRTLVLNVCSGE